jgi:glycosyltransferase involved in cell wall biosynthesis
MLYNSIDLNDLPFDSHELADSHLSIQTLKEKTNLCYFACIERGFKMALEISNQLNYKLYTNTYYQPFQYLLKQNNCIMAENSAKHTIFNYLKKSKYFVYPLINLDNGVIHYDTFAYVVLEALLMGVVVIAPKIGVYEELYGDAVCYIQTDDIIPKEDLLNWKKRMK